MQRAKALAFLGGGFPFEKEIKACLQDYLKEVEKLYDWRPCGGGAEIDSSLESLYLSFDVPYDLCESKAREELSAALALLKEKINTDEKIIPFLVYYPINEASLSIYLKTPSETTYSSEELLPETLSLPLQRNSRKYFE